MRGRLWGAREWEWGAQRGWGKGAEGVDVDVDVVERVLGEFSV